MFVKLEQPTNGAHFLQQKCENVVVANWPLVICCLEFRCLKSEPQPKAYSRELLDINLISIDQNKATVTAGLRSLSFFFWSSKSFKDQIISRSEKSWSRLKILSPKQGHSERMLAVTVVFFFGAGNLREINSFHEVKNHDLGWKSWAQNKACGHCGLFFWRSK